MALQSEDEQLSTAWRALDRRAEGHGWQVIDLSSAKTCPIMAGRRGPGNEESLLVGIPDITVGKESQLPRGQGFAVIHTELQGQPSRLAWLAVIRQPGGQLPLFTLMAADLVSLVRRIGSEPGTKVYVQLISRINAWQRFMARDRLQVLTAEEEVGLVGELVVLGNLIADGMPETDAIKAWEGPEDGLHDFKLGTGGIEAKTTLAPTGFIARIGNLDQLDNTLFEPLYIGAVRLSQVETGRTLPEIAEDLLNTITGSGAEELFEGKLGSAGYLPMVRDHYTRKFVARELTYRLVTKGAPRLTRSNVPAQIIEARYTLDLDVFPVVASTFTGISDGLGILK
jgi:hypothetical protein